MDKTDWVQAIWVMKTPSGKGWESSSIICNWKMFQSASEIDYDVHKLLKLMIFDDFLMTLMILMMTYPLVNVYITMENQHL